MNAENNISKPETMRIPSCLIPAKILGFMNNDKRPTKAAKRAVSVN
jgi:hypothetical protein